MKAEELQAHTHTGPLVYGFNTGTSAPTNEMALYIT